MRTKPCDHSTKPGRLMKARQFWEAADLVAGLSDGEPYMGDAYVTLCVHAGIAAEKLVKAATDRVKG